MSPTARSTNAAPSTAPAMPYTTRVLSLTCAATRVNAAKNSPSSANDSPNTTEPVAGRPCASKVTVTRPPVARSMPATVVTATAVRECGPIGRDRSSSARAGFLFAAGEAPHHQEAHQRDGHQPERADLKRDLAAERVQTLRGTVERNRGGVTLGSPRAACSRSACVG